MKGLTRAIAIFNIVIGAILILSIIGILWGTIYSVTGIIFLGYSKLSDDELLKKRPKILGMGILNLCFLGIISAILMFILYSKLNQYNLDTKIVEPNPQIDPDVKRLNILMQLGAFLVILSGIVFATSSWASLSGGFKVGFLIFISFIFYVLNVFMDKLLKLDKSAKTYYFLSLMMFSFAYLCAGYFKIFGVYFSLFGDGIELFVASLTLLISILMLISFKKYKHYIFLILTYSGLMLALTFFLQFIDLEYQYNVLALSIISLIFMINKASDNVYLKTLKLFNYGFVVYIALNDVYLISNKLIYGKIDLFTIDSFVLLVITSITVMISYLFAIRDKNDFYQIIAPITTVVIAIELINVYSSNQLFNLSILMTIAFTIYLISFANRSLERLNKTSFILSNLQQAIIYSSSFSLLIEYQYMPLLFALTIIAFNLYVVYRDQHYVNNLEIYVQPIKILLVVFGLYHFLKDYISIIDIQDCLIIAGFIFGIIYYFQRDYLLKNLYFKAAIISTAIYYLITMSSSHILFNIMNVVSFAILYFIAYRKEEEHSEKLVLPLLVATLFSIFTTLDGLELAIGIHQIIMILFMLGLVGLTYAFCNADDEESMGVAILFAVLPYSIIINNLTLDYYIVRLLRTLGGIYFIIGFSRIMLYSYPRQVKSAIEIIGILLLVSNVIFIREPVIGVTLGVLGLIFIIVGYLKKTMGSIFACGVTITLANIIIQLWDLWSNINFGIYLFVAGIMLISIVTYRELQHKKQPKPSQSAQPSISQIFSTKNMTSIGIKILMVVLVFVLYSRYSIMANQRIEQRRMAERYQAFDETYAERVDSLYSQYINTENLIFQGEESNNNLYLYAIYQKQGYQIDQLLLKSVINNINPENYGFELITISVKDFKRLEKDYNFYDYQALNQENINLDY